MSLQKLKNKIHQFSNSSEFQNAFEQLKADVREAVNIEEPGDHKPYYTNHVARELFQKAADFGLNHLIEGEVDAGFRPVAGDTTFLDSAVTSLSTPTLGISTDSDTMQVTLTSTTVTDASTYQFQVSTSSDFSSPTNIQNTSSTTATYEVTSIGTFYFRLRACGANSSQSNWTAIQNVSSEAWTPAKLSTIAWYDASDTSTITTSNAGDDVIKMTDKSSNGFDLTVITANKVGPDSGTRTLNDLNVLEYSKTSTSSNVILEHNGFNQNQPIVLTMLVHLDDEGISTGEQDFLISFTEQQNPRLSIRRTTGNSFQVLSNSGAVGSGNGSVTEPGEYLVTVYFNSTGTSLRINGSFINSGSVANNTLVNINLGGEFNENQCLDGFIAETIFYPQNSDIIKIEGYVAHKWGQSSKLPSDHLYKTSAPLTF